MSSPIVFLDIAGPEDDVLRTFYKKIFDWRFTPTGQIELDVLQPLRAAIRQDPKEKRLYVGVPDVTACLEAIERAGGSIDTPRFEVPGLVVLGLFRDPAGNPMGLVEMDGDKPRVPPADD